ncbi:hypothetical protein P152DRAFT_206346 [Eremomyces bilateralis CBS 781.70]|uniref:Uncharacterized protein n=1 Tax=Eremomyces bilateralis CBS 781.70 TaxID=1392243 RepID=A0A6G1FSX8_9PEZI|nr:uncharacterized protein P152DRAFT_206346 [Eremomyces bilateralis CBS 781.70]KAF1808863.1 hypothetical protein P152DRAFT_206346 [Eremomyces bilateralis CBS 781.70]
MAGTHLQLRTLAYTFTPKPTLTLFAQNTLSRSHNPLWFVYRHRYDDIIRAQKERRPAPRFIWQVHARADAPLFKRKLVRSYCIRKLKKGFRKALDEAGIDDDGREVVKGDGGGGGSGGEDLVGWHPAAAPMDKGGEIGMGRKRIWGLCTMWVNRTTFDCKQEEVDKECQTLLQKIIKDLGGQRRPQNVLEPTMRGPEKRQAGPKPNTVQQSQRVWPQNERPQRRKVKSR